MKARDLELRGLGVPACPRRTTQALCSVGEVCQTVQLLDNGTMDFLNGMAVFISENSGAVSAWAAIAAAVIAAVTLGKMAADSSASSRPYIYMYLEPDKFGTKVFLHAKNYGKSAARRVRITFPDDFAPGEPGENNISGYVKQQLSGSVFDIWPPGYEISNVYALARPNAGEFDPPENVKVKVRYARAWWLPDYRISFILDRRVFNQQLFIRIDRDLEQRLKELNKTLKSISTHLRNIAKKE